MYDVVLLSLAGGDSAATGCGNGDSCCGTRPEAGSSGCGDTPRVPVLKCADALTAAGARVEMVTARSDAEIDAVLRRLDGPARPDGLDWPNPADRTRLVVATASDGQLRAVIRRMVRRYAPPPSRRPADLADNRTVPDLPPIAVLPLDPTRPWTASSEGAADRPPGPDLAGQLGLPRDPAEVAAAVLAGRIQRLDLLRTDAGSVTLDGTLLGAADEQGQPLAWRGRVEVDGTVLATGTEPLLACVVGNAAGYAESAGVPLLSGPDPADGLVEVAVAVPVTVRSRWRRERVRLEVRRARGRAVAVMPRDAGTPVPFLDDGVPGDLTRKRSWWIEPGAWAVFAG